MNYGLRFSGGLPIMLASNLTGQNLNASQILTVSGTGTQVTFQGHWQGDGGNAFPSLFLREGGRFVFGAEASADFINNAFFTRQLWVSGDGTHENAGRVEFEAGFVADRSDMGTVDDGWGSIRLKGAVVLTRHTQNIPLGYRPRPGHPDGPQTNGHFVFEHQPGKWIVADQAQVYPGGVWIRADAELQTLADLTHTGITEDDTVSSFPYRAGNAFQTNEPALRILKTGPARLILAGEQAYRPGTRLQIREGEVRFETNPAAGFFQNGIGSPLAAAGPDLLVEVEAGGRAAFVTPVSEFHALQLDGELAVELHDPEITALQIADAADLDGDLHISFAPGFTPAVGTAIRLLSAGQVTGTFQSVSVSGPYALDVEITPTAVWVTPQPPENSNIREILYDTFANLNQWKDLSTAVTWTSTPEAHTVFQISPDGDSPHVLNLNDASRTVGMWGENGIRAFSAIDHQFAEPILHRDSIVTIEFRARWEALNSAEGNRMVIMLIHDYPEGGLDLTPDEKFNDFTQNWWARPAYQVRLRPGSPNVPGSFPILLYGGGNAAEGEFERNDDFWMPGFSSAPGGTAPGVGSPWPNNGWTLGGFSPAATSYRRFRYVVKPNQQELWVNLADDGVEWMLVAEMPLPFEEDAPPGAPLYRYFEHFEGIRIYFRSPGSGNSARNVYVDEIRVTVESLSIPPLNGFAAWLAQQLPDHPESGPEDDPFNHGITNLQRYAFGLPADVPPSPEQRPRLHIVPATGLSFVRPENGRPDISYIVRITDNLLGNSWHLIPDTSWVRIPDGDGQESVFVAIDPEDHPAFFGSIEVMLDPE